VPTKNEKQPLSVTHPELAKEADGWDAKTVTAGSGKKMSWKCPIGHTYISAIGLRARTNGTGCPICSGRKILVGFNDLKTLNPELANEAHEWDPTTVTIGSNKKVSWKCSLGHVFPAEVTNRIAGRGCPYCANKTVLEGFNDLATTNPTLAKEAFGWDPTTITFGSSKKVSWICSLGHVWSASVASRQHSGCPTCGNRVVETGFNDLATTNPTLAKEAYGWDPTKVSEGSHNKFKWKCQYGHIFSAIMTNRSRRNDRCPICAGKTLVQGFNDLATTNPLLAEEAHGWDASSFSKGMNVIKEWKCPIGHIFKATINNRSSGRDCPFCSGNKVLAGFNDLETTHPEIAKEMVDGDPSKISKGSTKKFTWKCSMGHTWRTGTDSRTNMKSGCPSCAEYGFNPSKDGFLYFLNHSEWGTYQIGITNFPDDRLKTHRKLGWELLELRGPMDGHLTQQWETAILRMLKAKGADLSNAAIAGKFDGYSEAWSKATFDVKSIKELMRMTEEFEER